MRLKLSDEFPETSNMLMLMDAVRQQNGDQLSDPTQEQFGMKRLGIPCPPAVQTATVLEVIDRPLDRTTDFVGAVPLICITDCPGIQAKITFRIDVDHTSAF